MTGPSIYPRASAFIAPRPAFWATGVDTLKVAGYYGGLKAPGLIRRRSRFLFNGNLGEYLIMSLVTRRRTSGASSKHRIPW